MEQYNAERVGTTIRGDVVDIANERADEMISDAIAHARHALAKMPVEGFCLFCGTETLFTRFCDGDCGEDYERAEAARRRNGRPQ